LFLKRNDLRLIGAEVRDFCGSSGTGETPQAFTPRMLILIARPAESEHLEGKLTTPHYLVNSNKVCENSLDFCVYILIAPIKFPMDHSDYFFPIKLPKREKETKFLLQS
jgi:hypothetical protein